VLFVPDPCALSPEPFAGANGGGGTDDGYKLTMAGGLDPQDAEAGILVKECHSLYEA
jgi:hypothetical protein